MAIGLVAPARAAVDEPRLTQLEAAAAADPENLWLCAQYRQQAIRVGAYDRAIKALGRLAARRDAGPSVFMSLALAYLDKAPTVSPFRRIFLGRDATDALTQSIDRQPSVVAYYIRGLISLYYTEAVFHRAPRAIADLTRARALADAEPVQPYHVRIFVSLGDAYWKLNDLATARTVWTEGLRRFPHDEALRVRLADPQTRDRAIRDAIDSSIRVDTSLRELFPTADQ